jgi:hypothetical protein
MKPARLLARLLCAALGLAVSLTGHLAARAGDDWKPIDPAHLNLKAPVVEKDADAEAIFWEVRVADEDTGGEYRAVLTHYVRIKVFTERGKESQSRIDLPYLDRYSIKDIAARTIKPDGSIIELKKDAVFERTIVKASGLKVKAKSFALPGVEPGCIVEYRYREYRPTTYYRRLQFQRDVPVQFVKYYVKPLSHPLYAMRALPFHCSPTPITKEPGGFHSTTLSNVPAFREEPRMPPEDEVRPWLLIYYSEDKKLDAAKYWQEYGKESYNEFKNRIKVNDDVKRAAAEVTAGAGSADEKLERLLTFCRTKIKNIQDDAAGVTEQDRKKMKENNSTADTLKRGYGTYEDVDLLFAALAQGAGFESRVVRLSDRGDVFFDPSFPDKYFIEDIIDIAVKVDGQWKFFDPSSRYVPAGMLSWKQEGIKGLLTDSKEPAFLDMPLSPSAKSRQKSTAKLRLGEDGTVEGDVRIEFTGHLAVQAKENADEESQAEREESLKKMVTRTMGAAEFADIRIEPNLDDAAKPFVYAFKVRVPGYAQRTGKRLFLQPAFFQYGDAALFTAGERKHAVYFSFPWTEEDDVEIELPAGYVLDHADSPQPFNASDIVKYDVKIGVTKDARTLVFNRKFTFDGMFFRAEVYPNLKKVFDLLHQQDAHTITLKQGTATAAKD